MTHLLGLHVCLRLLAGGMVALLVGCGRHDAFKTLTLIFDVSPDKNVSVVDLARDTGHAIALNPETLACRGAGEFKEYRPEAPVMIHNERGMTIGSGLLGPGKIITTSVSKTGVKLFKGCRFESRISLRAPALIYVVTIANGKYKEYLHVSQLKDLGGIIKADVD